MFRTQLASTISAPGQTPAPTFWAADASSTAPLPPQAYADSLQPSGDRNIPTAIGQRRRFHGQLRALILSHRSNRQRSWGWNLFCAEAKQLAAQVGLAAMQLTSRRLKRQKKSAALHFLPVTDVAVGAPSSRAMRR